MKKKATRKHTAEPKRMPCTCEYNKGIAAMFDESFGRLREMGPEPVEEFNHALMHSDNFHSMMHCLCNDDDCDPGYLMSDMFRLGWEAGKRQQEVQYLEKMCGIK